MKRPPQCLAQSQLKKAVRMPPMCIYPVGLGANRVRTVDMRATYVQVRFRVLSTNRGDDSRCAKLCVAPLGVRGLVPAFGLIPSPTALTRFSDILRPQQE